MTTNEDHIFPYIDIHNITILDSNSSGNNTVKCYEVDSKRTTAVIITAAYSFILIAGIIENLLTGVVILANKHMHTATNYYLFSLAISDICFLVIGIPNMINMQWNYSQYIYGYKLCIFIKFILELSANASVLVIVAFTVERYIVVCHSLKARTVCKLTRTVKIIVCVWFLSALLALPISLQYEGISLQLKQGDARLNFEYCILSKPINLVVDVLFVMLFVIPMVVILVLYILIGVTLKHSSVKNNEAVDCDCRRESCNCSVKSVKDKLQHSRNSTICMLVVVVIAFFTCWAPIHALKLIYRHFNLSFLVRKSFYYTADSIYYLRTTINPIIYNVFSVKFRQAFKSIFYKCCNQSASNIDTTYSFRCQRIS